MFEINAEWGLVLNPDGTWNRRSGTSIKQHLNTEHGVSKFLEEHGALLKNISISNMYTKEDLTSKFLEVK